MQDAAVRERQLAARTIEWRREGDIFFGVLRGGYTHSQPRKDGTFDDDWKDDVTYRVERGSRTVRFFIPVPGGDGYYLPVSSDKREEAILEDLRRAFPEAA